jgi:hypothetical protein
MPDLPGATRSRLDASGLSKRDIDVLMSVDAGREVGFDGELGTGAVSYFDAVAAGRDPKHAANWWVMPVCSTAQFFMRHNVPGLQMSFSASYRCAT